MAHKLNQVPIYVESFLAGEDLSAKQNYGVELASDGDVELVDNIADTVVGILMNKPESGEEAQVMVIGRAVIVATETIATGDQIRIHSDGKAAIFVSATDTTAHAVGVCTSGGDSGELIAAMVQCANVGALHG